MTSSYSFFLFFLNIYLLILWGGREEEVSIRQCMCHQRTVCTNKFSPSTTCIKLRSPGLGKKHLYQLLFHQPWSVLMQKLWTSVCLFLSFFVFCDRVSLNHPGLPRTCDLLASQSLECWDYRHEQPPPVVKWS